jgi:hypothetical protein
MGAHPYWYVVQYQPDANAALKALRQREFRAGRYNPVQVFPHFPVDANDPGPGAEHDSIEEAMEDADADGSRSILDLDGVSDEPETGSACRLDNETLTNLYGTTMPTRDQFDAGFFDLWEIEQLEERGQGVYFTLYQNDKPDALVFAGYSFD